MATREAAPAPYDPDLDPAITDPDKYVVIFENALVRVLRYRDCPDARTHPHTHPSAILYALSSFRRRFTYPDGSTSERDFEAGEVLWLSPVSHVSENTGATPTEALIVELKGR